MKKSAVNFTQSTPALTWTIVHNLNCVPVSDVIDASGEKILPYDVKHIDNTTMQIIFQDPTAGTARLVSQRTNHNPS